MERTKIPGSRGALEVRTELPAPNAELLAPGGARLVLELPAVAPSLDADGEKLRLNGLAGPPGRVYHPPSDFGLERRFWRRWPAPMKR